MKKIFFLLLIFIAIPLLSFSQEYWEQLYFPDTADITCLAVNNVGDLFVGTGSNQTTGALYRSTDSAESWELLFENGDFSVNSISLNNQGTIYISKGGFTKILTSTDNGDSWDTIQYPSYITANIGNIEASGVDTLFISTAFNNGVILFRSYDNGNSWDSIFTTHHNTSESIQKILISPNPNIIYLALSGHLENMGGVYKSADGGDTWEFIGLYNYMVTSLALNNAGDLFAGSYGGLADTAMQGIYVLRAGNENWQGLSYPQVNDIIIISEDEIFCSTAWPNGVVRSTDNGNTFELINEGLASGEMRDLAIDNSGYIYVTNLSSLNRTINPTVSINEKMIDLYSNDLEIYPNPASSSLFIKPNHPFSNKQNLEINIFSSLGKLVRQPGN